MWKVRGAEEGLVSGENGVRSAIALAMSPGGKKCVKMTVDKRDWILVGAFKRRAAFDQGLHFHKIGIESKQDMAFDWRQSVATNELVPLVPTFEGEPVVGIYIPADKFDGFIDAHPGKGYSLVPRK